MIFNNFTYLHLFSIAVLCCNTGLPCRQYSWCTMISALVSRLISLGLGTLYPAYASYKAVRTKNVKEYVKVMIHKLLILLMISFMFSG